MDRYLALRGQHRFDGLQGQFYRVLNWGDDMDLLHVCLSLYLEIPDVGEGVCVIEIVFHALLELEGQCVLFQLVCQAKAH